MNGDPPEMPGDRRAGGATGKATLKPTQGNTGLPRPACTISQAAQALQVTRQTIHNLINRGELRRFKIGAATRLNTAEVLSLIGGDNEWRSQ